MTIATRDTEQADLAARLADAEAIHDAIVAEWVMRAQPIHLRILKLEEWALLSNDWKPVHVARADLRNLGECPQEPLALLMLRSRLDRLMEPVT